VSLDQLVQASQLASQRERSQLDIFSFFFSRVATPPLSFCCFFFHIPSLSPQKRGRERPRRIEEKRGRMKREREKERREEGEGRRERGRKKGRREREKERRRHPSRCRQ